MSNATLIKMKGSWEATREQVNAIEVPARTWSYTPIPHERVIDLLERKIPLFGMKIEATRLALNTEGKKMFGVMEVTNGTGADDWRFALGFRNSYDKSLKLSVTAGSKVMVCDNLSFNGEISTHHKHNGRVDLFIDSYVDRLLRGFVEKKRGIEEFITGMKKRDLTDQQAYHFIIRAMRNKVIPTSHVEKVVEQWHEPKHEEFRERTQWSLYNGFTEVAKTRSAEIQMDSTLGLTTLVRQWNEEMGS